MLPLACPDTATRVAGGRIPSHPRPVQPSPQWDRELMAQYRAQLSGPSINNPPSAFRPARLSTTSVEVESGLRLSASRSSPRLPSGPVAALIRLVAYGHRQCRRMAFQPHRSNSHAANFEPLAALSAPGGGRRFIPEYLRFASKSQHRTKPCQ
jgi:hypothetical protein